MFPNPKENKSLSQRITKMTKEKPPNDKFLEQKTAVKISTGAEKETRNKYQTLNYPRHKL